MYDVMDLIKQSYKKKCFIYLVDDTKDDFNSLNKVG